MKVMATIPKMEGDWKTITWSEESLFLLQHLDGRLRI